MESAPTENIQTSFRELCQEECSRNGHSALLPSDHIYGEVSASTEADEVLHESKAHSFILFKELTIYGKTHSPEM